MLFSYTKPKSVFQKVKNGYKIPNNRRNNHDEIMKYNPIKEIVKIAPKYTEHQNNAYPYDVSFTDTVKS